MKHKSTASLFALGLCTLITTQARAGEWVLGPAFEEGWKPEFTVAAMGGILSPEGGLSDDDTFMGVEVSLNCPWFQPPSGSIRQQFWIGRYEEGGVTYDTFEINPRYYMDTGSGWSVGFGPGFGLLQAETPYKDSVDMFTLQLGADVGYRSGALFIGVGTRYQFTMADKDLGGGQEGADNWVTVAKVGINF